jgi:diguanylate cyclase (GGDEF)-like protein
VRDVEVTSGGRGLTAVCRAALDALDAERIMVWRASRSGVLSPYVVVTRDPPPARRSVDGGPKGMTAGAGAPSLTLDWADLPDGEPAVVDADGRRHAVRVDAPADGTGRFAEMAAATGMGSAYCRWLEENVPLGLLVIEPAGATGGAPTEVLAASATSSLAAQAVIEARTELELILELTEATATCSPVEVLRLGCRRLAQVLGVRRASILSEDEFGSIVRLSELADGSLDVEGWARIRATAEPFPLVAQVLASGRPAIAEGSSSALIGPWWAGTMGMRAALAVPIGERGVLVLDHDEPVGFRPDQVRLVVAVATQLGEPARSARHGRKRAEHEAASAAFRQLLETGVRASTPMEAAEALAATAAKVLDMPTACAYLVDDAGRISDVATVGAAPGLGVALRRSLVGRLAADSPVWQRTVEGEARGPDLIADTKVAGVVRPGGVAETLGLRSLAAIPLLSSDGPLGLVLCGDPQPRERWRSGDRTVLEQLALEGTVVVDNARLRQSERHEASHDALTGLLNRRAFMDRFRHTLAAPSPRRRPVAVLVLDLDRFKQVNDHLGHHCGDELLRQVAQRLRASTTPADVVARMGGDEFALLLAGEADREGVQARAGSILAALEEPVFFGARALRIEASIGVALAPEHGEEATGLLQRADLAMYAAKRSGRGHEVYGPATDPEPGGGAGLLGALGMHAELGLLGELRHALHGGDELLLRYQPKIDLRSGLAAGAEALVRWDHPVHGLLGPDYFVPVAEESGLVRALTAWVVPKALAQLRAWRDDGVEVCVAVNISARDVNDPGFVARLEGWLDDAGLPGGCLVVEVTESSLMGEGAHTRGALQRIRALGIRVSLDDFGTGYSSLAYLESLPVDELKIDRRFLLPEHPGRSVVRSIISLGHDLGLRVVAEGVENAEHAAWLAAAGCDQAQGYHFAEPLDASGFGDWWARHARPPSVLAPVDRPPRAAGVAGGGVTLSGHGG